MNWQACRNTPGSWVTMQGTATKFDLKQGQHGPYGLGFVTDVTGETQKVLFGSKKDDPPPSVTCLNQLAVWGAGYDANKQNYKVMFNNFVEHQQAPQEGQSASQTTAQAPQPTSQSTNGPEQDVWDAKDLRMARMNALNRAVEVAIAYKADGAKTGNMQWDELFRVAELCKHYIYNGITKAQGARTKLEKAYDDYAGKPVDRQNDFDQANTEPDPEIHPEVNDGIPY